MLDHHEVRMWADHHEALAAWGRRLLDQIDAAFEALVRIQYAAPWENSGRGKGSAIAPAPKPGSTLLCRC